MKTELRHLDMDCSMEYVVNVMINKMKELFPELEATSETDFPEIVWTFERKE
jgi:hypothetical protein